MESKAGGIQKNEPPNIIDPFRAQTIRELAISYFKNTFAMANKYLQKRGLAFETVLDAFFMLLWELSANIKRSSRYLPQVVKYRTWNLYKRGCKLFNEMNPTPEVEILLFFLSKKKPRYAQILRLYYLEELSHEEIAEIMNTSAHNCRALLERAKVDSKKIYKYLSTEYTFRRNGTGENILPFYIENKQPRLGDSGKRLDENTLLDYVVGGLQGLEKLQIEHLINEDPLYSNVLDGYTMLLEDFGNKENVQQLLDCKRRLLIDRLLTQPHSASDETSNNTGGNHLDPIEDV